MLSPYQIPYFIRYFDGIDAAVSTRLSRKVPPSETTLTDEFLALLDVDNQRREGLLNFSADDLQTAIAFPGDLLDVDFHISAHQHAQKFEAYVSQADFGLVMEYQNTVLPELNWTAAYLMQAKRLFRDAGGVYSLKSKFESVSDQQTKRMQDLANILGEDAIRYCLYMPQTNDYALASASAIRTLHTRNLSCEIYDFAVGLALHDSIRASGGIDAGIWISSIASACKTAAQVHSSAFGTAHPLTWFILRHFGELSHHTRNRMGLNQHHRQSTSSDNWVERVSKIATGDPAAAQALIDELGDAAREREVDPESMKVLPGYSVTIRVKSGPPEGFDLPISRYD